MIDLKQLQFDFEAGYKANYGARVGQTISGSLGRGAGGRFARVGSGAPSSSGATNQANAGKQQRRAAALQASGVNEDQAAALENFAKGGTLSAAQQADLASAGLVRVGDDGTARLAPNARGFIRALRKGDARAAADAASAARDAVSKRAAAAARRDEAAKRRAQREADRAAKKKQPKAPKAPKQPTPLSPEATQRAGNRAEEIEAQIDDAVENDKTLTNAQLVKSMNRLDEIETQLQKASDGEEKTTALETVARARQKLLAMQGESNVVTREASCMMEVFKDANGSPRWLLITSNAYEDREGEIVSRAALEADVERWWARRDSGERWHDPLRWWHVGTVNKGANANWQDAEAGVGMDIGQCDYCLMHGNMLIESGTFDSEELADAFAPHMKNLRVSLGFATPWYQPINGVYTDIHRFERSLLPAAKEANALTGGIVIKEKKDMTKRQDKVKAFASIAGENAATVLSGFLNTVQEVDKQAEATGIRHKEGEAGDEPGSPNAQEAQGEVESNVEGIPPIKSAKRVPSASGRDTEAVRKEAAAEVSAPAAEVSGKAVGDAPVEEAEGDGAIMVGDMTPEELVAALAEPLAAAMAAAMKPVAQALSEQETTIKEQGAKLAKVEKELGEAQKKVKELEGDAPSGHGYQASKDEGTVNKEAAFNLQPVNELAQLAGHFLNSRRNGN